MIREPNGVNRLFTENCVAKGYPHRDPLYPVPSDRIFRNLPVMHRDLQWENVLKHRQEEQTALKCINSRNVRMPLDIIPAPLPFQHLQSADHAGSERLCIACSESSTNHVSNLFRLVSDVRFLALTSPLPSIIRSSSSEAVLAFGGSSRL